jgi:dihydrofolate reductase
LAPRTGDLADRINALPKYVASSTLEEPLEGNATLLEVDLAAEVSELKAKAGQNILKYGTGELTISLMKHNLIDEFHFWHFPVAVGGGKRLLEGVDTTHLELVDTTTFKSGIVVCAYVTQSSTQHSSLSHTRSLKNEAGLSLPRSRSARG